MNRSLILDTQLLCLFAVGRLKPDWIEKHRRLQAYTSFDFALLVRVLSSFSRLIATPHILTETSNLLRQTPEPLASLAALSLAEFIALADEESVPGVEIVRRPEYIRLGIADGAILSLLADGNTLLSADLDLYLAGAAAGYSVYNFNHLRDGAIEL